MRLPLGSFFRIRIGYRTPMHTSPWPYSRPRSLNALTELSHQFGLGYRNSDSFEIHEFIDRGTVELNYGSKIVLTCEHATNSLPRPYQWMEDDKWVQDMHWAWDPGAKDIALDFAENYGCTAITAGFSRLLCDANRPIASSTIFRDQCDGRTIHMNTDLRDSEIQWRLWHYYLPYHIQLGRVANTIDPVLIISVHTFNPIYEGETRDFEVGILCTFDSALCTRIASHLHEHGMEARVNEPWSGKDGFMYSADSLAVAQPAKRRAIMLEVRNDVAVDPSWRSRFVKALRSALGDVDGDGVPRSVWRVGNARQTS